jgi:hypothetical protein
MRQQRTLLKITDDAIMRRFEQKVDRRGPDECWPWMGYRMPSGQGQFGIGRTVYLSSRVSYALYNGPVPGDMFVCHRCDNPPCVNPAHLFLGSALDNNRDCKTKGRNAKGEMMRAIRRRQDQCNRKLTADQVAEIRRLHVRGSKTNGRNALARRFGTTPQNIGLVISGRTWAHVGGVACV